LPVSLIRHDQASPLSDHQPHCRVPHAERVVDALAGPADIEAFVRGWRAHFLAAMRPRFLPPHWSVDARVANSSHTTSASTSFATQ
jgi:hypothetical protein